MPSNYSKSLLNRTYSAWIKGLLTLFIILGHDLIFTNGLKEYGVMSYLYIFHIQGFFILPFLYDVNRPAAKAKDIVIRFYWPYFIMVSLAMLSVGIFTHFQNFSWAGLARLYIVCDPSSIRQICGFQILWFLPAMMTTMLLKDLYYRSGKVFRVLLLLLSVIFMLFAVCANTSYDLRAKYLGFVSYTPLGVSYAIQMLALGVLLRWLTGYIERHCCHALAFLISLGCFLICSGLYVKYVAFTISASDLNVIYALLQLIAPLFFMIAIVCILMLSKPKLDNTIIGKLGGRSLYVYLVSPFVGYLFYFLFREFNLMYWWWGLLIWPVITAVSYIATFLVTKRINKLIFPHNLLEWKLLFKRAHTKT